MEVIQHIATGQEAPTISARCTETEGMMAAIAIRLGDFAEAYGVSLEAEIKRKMEFNETRPYKHGKNI